MRTTMITAMLVVATTALFAPQATAQSSSGGWEYSIAPYMWASGMEGKMTIADIEGDLDVPFETIVENLDLALMAHYDMRNDRWVLTSDLIFVDLEHAEDVEGGTVTAGLDMTIFEVVVGYRVSPAVALLAGARWVDMGTSLQLSGEPEGDGSASKDWIDPLVGVQVFTPLSEKWWVGVRGDIGGFGVGSELSWQAYANLGLRVSRVTSLVLGYRALDIDYVDGELPHYVGLDLLVSGPQLGAVFTF